MSEAECAARSAPWAIASLDHLVLTVRDIEATCRFYETVLGMRRERFGDGRTALHFGPHKINLHQQGKEFEPKAERPTPGSGDLCLIAPGPIDAIVAHVESCGVAIEEGPVPRSGAQGPISSIYIRDPDANLIEIACY
jgi:catechol 2,3-dioxygenase-like lactoylglutathione lyase family enzyme